jgi:single-stranded-DNA-specific exonuclease
MLAPRVNAAGRMSTPDIATRLLLACDESMGDEARALAMQLDAENVRRREEEATILAAAKKIVQTDPDVGARTVLVVAGEGWHRGVIGIVASKLVDAFHRPAIVLSIDGPVAHGSCRSISRFDMLGALERSAHLLSRFGGHRQAAGLTMDADRVRELRRQSTARLRGAQCRDHRWTAKAEGAPSQDDAQAGWTHLSRDSLARRRATRLSGRPQGRDRRGLFARAE